MSAALHKLDVRGNPTTKQCPSCQAIVGRTAPRCKECGHLFVGKWNRHPERPVGTPGRKKGISPGRKASAVTFDKQAAIASERKLLELADVKPNATGNVVAIGTDPDFYSTKWPNGALLVKWPTFGVQLTFTPDEAAILVKALTP